MLQQRIARSVHAFGARVKDQADLVGAAHNSARSRRSAPTVDTSLTTCPACVAGSKYWNGVSCVAKVSLLFSPNGRAADVCHYPAPAQPAPYDDAIYFRTPRPMPCLGGTVYLYTLVCKGGGEFTLSVFCAMDPVFPLPSPSGTTHLRLT